MVTVPRIARIRGEYATYHIIQRGNERKNIFYSDDNKVRFLDTLQRMKKKYNFKLEAYCIMDNHVHLLINDNGNDISKIMKSLNISYAYYYNRVNKRIGHLFQDRFRSELTEDDPHLISVGAYIHNNPVKAGMVKVPQEYKWSSFCDYLGKRSNRAGLVDMDRILGVFFTNKKQAVKDYYEYVLKYEPKTEIIDVEQDTLLLKKEKADYIESYEAAKTFAENHLQTLGISSEDLLQDKTLRRELIKKLRKNSCLTLKEIGDLA